MGLRRRIGFIPCPDCRSRTRTTTGVHARGNFTMRSRPGVGSAGWKLKTRGPGCAESRWRPFRARVIFIRKPRPALRFGLGFRLSRLWRWRHRATRLARSAVWRRPHADGAGRDLRAGAGDECEGDGEQAGGFHDEGDKGTDLLRGTAIAMIPRQTVRPSPPRLAFSRLTDNFRA